MQSDGDDCRLVVGVVNDTGYVAYTEISRRPIHTFGVDTTYLEFVIPQAIAADSVSVTNYLIQCYFKYREANNPPKVKVHPTAGLYKKWDSFESYTADSSLGKSSNWTVVGADTVKNYTDANTWFYPIWDGGQCVISRGVTSAKYSGSLVIGPKTLVGAYLKSGSGSQIWLELYDDHSRCYKLGHGAYDADTRGIFYNRGDSAGWALSDSVLFVDSYNDVRFRIGGVAMANGAYPIYGYVNDMLIFSSSDDDTAYTGRQTSGSVFDYKFIDETQSWDVDGLIGDWLKITSGTYKDTVRQITDNTATNVIFAALPGNVAQYDSFAIWDSTLGYAYSDPQDSIRICTDSTAGRGTTPINYFDGFYLRKTYDSYMTDEAIDLSTSVNFSLITGRRRPYMIKMGGF